MKKYYVTMTDSVLSGWGRAKNKINKLVIECDSYEEAEIVSYNAESRSEMKYINIAMKKPSYSAKRYLTSYHDKSDYAEWFIPNYFTNQK